MRKILLIALVVVAFSLSQGVSVYAGCSKSHSASKLEGAKSDTLEEVGNKVCPVMGGKIREGNEVKVEHEGKVYNLCCAGCIQSFKSDPDKYIKIVEETLKKDSE